jgi:DNA-binding transcriptional ArsR family regulator
MPAVLRINFTESDLTQIRLADEPDPMWEALLSLHLLQEQQATPRYAAWRSRVGGRFDADLRPLLALAPPRGYSADFLTPDAAADGIEAGLDALRHTPAETFRTDLGVLAGYTSQSYAGRFQALADGDRGAAHRLADKMARYHDLALRPYWMKIRGAVGAIRSSHAKELAAGGLGRLFGGLHPSMRWRDNVLELHGFVIDREIHLNGRGLRLVPSFFCRQAPIVLRDQSLPPVLVYPIDPDRVHPAPARPPSDGSLAALLGRTRAAILVATADGCTTTELARRLDISPATASHHASVLREAGLITTIRVGTSVLHTLHPKGDLLLNQ